MAHYERRQLNIEVRVRLALTLVCVAFSVLIVRLWYLQIIHGAYFRNRSENNRIRTVLVPAARGLLLDRNGEILAKNRSAFNIEWVAEDSPDVDGTLRKFENILNYPPHAFDAKKLSSGKRRPFEPKLLLRDVNREVVARVAAHHHELPGVIIAAAPVREYVYDDLASHALGYIREITQNQLEMNRYAGARYRLGEVIGQFGLEERLEEWMRGSHGRQLVEVNARGTRIGEFAFEPEREGHDVTLTLDLLVQRAADRALSTVKGAAVAMKADTGEILALSSSPHFDPNIFTSELSSEQWKAFHGEEKILSNRAVQGAYPPGSVFKIVTGLAALSEGLVNPNETVYCPGYFPFAGRNYRCHKHAGHGKVDFFSAMVQSCDVFFYTMGNRLGVDRIHRYATMFGLGSKTGLDLGSENSGLIPSSAWKQLMNKDKPRWDQKWYPGETLSVAIGQGAVTITPLQLARMVAAVVNGGHVMKPYLVSKIVSSEGVLLESRSPEQLGQADVKSEVFQVMKDSLVGVVNDPRGTGKRAQVPGVIIGGKTGTAQVVGLANRGDSDHFEDHAWFVAFAPAEKPEIVVSVLVENGGHGGSAAAPIAQQILDAYFVKLRPEYGPFLEEKEVL